MNYSGYIKFAKLLNHNLKFQSVVTEFVLLGVPAVRSFPVVSFSRSKIHWLSRNKCHMLALGNPVKSWHCKSLRSKSALTSGPSKHNQYMNFHFVYHQ